jgi:hypothetical protein
MRSAQEVGEVHRLMGASVCRMPGSVVEQLLAMRQGICRFNAKKGLRSALLYSGGWFLQWHEGPQAVVEEAWAYAQGHPGNAHGRVIHRSDGAGALPRTLHIASLHSRDKPSDVARRIYAIQRERDLGWVADPIEIWDALSAPCLVQDVDPMAAVARSHVVAVTSEYTESVDLVKAIAERGRSPVSYQRFADGDARNADIGAAYVDARVGGQVTRLQALSRRALEDGMVQMSLRRMECLVLLIGSRSAASARLAEAAASLLRTLPQRPSIKLVGPCADTAAEVAVCLQAGAGHDGPADIDIVSAGGPGRNRVDAVLDLIAAGECTRPAELDTQIS